jgi:hypothetical protein
MRDRAVACGKAAARDKATARDEAAARAEIDRAVGLALDRIAREWSIQL